MARQRFSFFSLKKIFQMVFKKIAENFENADTLIHILESVVITSCVNREVMQQLNMVLVVGVVWCYGCSSAACKFQ